jgi:sigma-E factor negative regulatory protein RseC
MGVEEEGVVTEARGESALVRAVETSQCAGCVSAKFCHGGGAGGEKIIEAVNTVGAREGDRVVISLPSTALLKASFQVYMVPVLGILAGAGAAQTAVNALAGPQAAGMAAGIGGLLGAILSVLAMRRLRHRSSAGKSLRPVIVKRR